MPDQPASDGIDNARLRGELDRALSDVREELARANTTAIGVAGAVATVAAVGLAALLAGEWTPTRLPLAGQVAWWAGVLCAVAGTALLGAVALPRLGDDAAGAPVSWVPIAAHRDLAALEAALASLAADPAPRVAYLRTLARIARRKWARVRAALLVLAVSGGLLVLTALTSATV